MKLEVGMYARTIRGKIFKVNEINVVGKYYYLDIRKERKIVKADYDIIDLIKTEDYVNGYPVTAILSSDNKVYEIQVKRPNNRNGVWIERIRKNEDIKSIVTKEQFESIKYKLKE